MCWNSLRRLFSRPQNYEIYTDGSWKRGRGAWAYVVVYRGKVLREDSGSVRKTNSYRMEFQAAIEALRSLEPHSRATVFSDSRIVVDTMTYGVPRWKSQGWQKDPRKLTARPLPGLEQIQALDAASDGHQVSWRWIKAHSGNIYNERCDELCILARSP